MKSLEERFWSKVNKTDGCWLWTACTSNGYGLIRLRLSKRNMKAHRFSWELTNGPVPNGACVLHRCDVRACVNPSHLFLGSYATNNADMASKGRANGGGLKGMAHGMCKLTDALVLECRWLYRAGGWTLKALGDKYGVSLHCVHKVVTRTNWRHI